MLLYAVQYAHCKTAVNFSEIYCQQKRKKDNQKVKVLNMQLLLCRMYNQIKSRRGSSQLFENIWLSKKKEK